MYNEKISVIVPVYNVEAYLEKCVMSIVYQSYQNLEILLIDDGSTDNSGTLCDELALKYSRIKVYHKQNGGLSDARNVGLENATGEIISFIDSDDFIHPEMYSLMLASMNALGVDVIECEYKGLPNSEIIIPAVSNYTVSISNRESVFVGILEWKKHYHYVWNKLYRKSLIHDLRFEVGKINEDVFFANAYLQKINKVGYISYPFYFYVKRNDSITGLPFSMKRLVILEAFFERYNILLTLYPALSERMLENIVKWLFRILNEIVVQGNDTDYRIRTKLSREFLRLYDEYMSCSLISEQDKQSISEMNNNAIGFFKKHEIKILYDKYCK